MSETEIESDDFMIKIFNESPSNKNSINVSFATNTDIKTLFEFLMSFVTTGSKILFANGQNGVDLNKWTDIEFELLNKYCGSIGFEFILDKYDLNDVNIIDFKKMNYKNQVITNYTKLNLLKLPIKCKKYIFVFSFNFLNP